VVAPARGGLPEKKGPDSPENVNDRVDQTYFSEVREKRGRPLHFHICCMDA